MMSVGDPTTTRRNGTVRALTEKQVRRSFVNCSRGEAEAMTLPRTFAETPWAELVVLGWRGPRAPWGGDVSLFPARGGGGAGRNGNPVGTYVCADLACALRARSEIPPWLRERDPEEVAAERTAELERRVHGFLDAVLR